MIKEVYILDYTTKEVINKFKRKGLNLFNKTIKGKKFVKKYGNRMVEFVTFGDVMNITKPIVISKDATLKLDFN